MAKKSTASLVRGSRAKKSARIVPDSEIDFSDIPELTDEQLKKMYRPGKPLREPSSEMVVSFRIKPKLLKKLEAYANKKGKDCEDLLSEIIGKFVRKQIV